MQVNPYLSFDGRCAEALKFYERCLGARTEFQITFGGSPMADQVPPEWHDKIMHASMSIGDQVLMGSDAPPDRYKAPQGMTVSLGIADPAEADRVFAGLSEGATIQMPIQETFWALRFGMLVDQFGIPWMVNCGKPM
ncbi:MAG TPA: VOC family protein [Aliidongia sp.]|nr:VOC family protein [Aliidongia sp.]